MGRSETGGNGLNPSARVARQIRPETAGQRHTRHHPALIDTEEVRGSIPPGLPARVSDSGDPQGRHLGGVGTKRDDEGLHRLVQGNRRASPRGGFWGLEIHGEDPASADSNNTNAPPVYGEHVCLAGNPTESVVDEASERVVVAHRQQQARDSLKLLRVDRARNTVAILQLANLLGRVTVLVGDVTPRVRQRRHPA